MTMTMTNTKEWTVMVIESMIRPMEDQELTIKANTTMHTIVSTCAIPDSLRNSRTLTLIIEFVNKNRELCAKTPQSQMNTARTFPKYY